jgi:hypothetical protein
MGINGRTRSAAGLVSNIARLPIGAAIGAPINTPDIRSHEKKIARGINRDAVYDLASFAAGVAAVALGLGDQRQRLPLLPLG